MDSEEEYLLNQLESWSYRQLQQMAKSMHLPSNFKVSAFINILEIADVSKKKNELNNISCFLQNNELNILLKLLQKIYLIELILAKKLKSDEDVDNVIKRVRLERLQQSQVKKYRHQKNNIQLAAQRISEANDSSCYSPPITVTPKRLSNSIIQYSPDIMYKEPLHPKRNLLRKIVPGKHNSNKTIKAVNSSDRVLRSYNLKTEKPNYALINNNVLEIKTQCCSETETKMKVIRHRGSKCYVAEHTLSEHSKTISKVCYDMIATSGDHIQIKSAKRQRRISGIYPLQPKETMHKNLSTIKSVSLRKIDGSYTTINALIRKCNVFAPKNSKYYNIKPEINMQDIIDFDVNVPEDLTITNNNNNCLYRKYPNMSGINPINVSTASIINTQITLNGNYKENNPMLDTQVIGYEKRVREEPLTCQNRWDSGCQQLPKINDVFRKLPDMCPNDLTRPLYVSTDMTSVTTEAERVQNNPVYVCRSNANGVLESMYNIKIDTQQQEQQQQKIPLTTCVFATKTISSTSVYPTPSSPSNDALNVTSPDIDPFPDVDMHIQDFLQLNPVKRTYFEFLDLSSSSSLDTIDTTTSIPEMVEDALEIISQDGDYMERMGISARIQCVFCSWAGPKIILEGHMRKEHSDSIHKMSRSDWNMTFTLESLVQRHGWFNRVVEYDSMLYMLSARYEDPGCFMATLSSLSTEPEPADSMFSITLYNKVTGEPFSWTGQIFTLPPNDDNIFSCFKIDLAKLDLLPNCANLKLVNEQLQGVTNSHEKVVVGRPDLNDVHIILFVRIYKYS